LPRILGIQRDAFDLVYEPLPSHDHGDVHIADENEDQTSDHRQIGVVVFGLEGDLLHDQWLLHERHTAVCFESCVVVVICCCDVRSHHKSNFCHQTVKLVDETFSDLMKFLLCSFVLSFFDFLYLTVSMIVLNIMITFLVIFDPFFALLVEHG